MREYAEFQDIVVISVTDSVAPLKMAPKPAGMRALHAARTSVWDMASAGGAVCSYR